MRKVLLAFVLVLLLPGLAVAQTDRVSVYGDVAGAACIILDTMPGLLFVYVVHSTLGATGSRFSAPAPSCMLGATWLSDDVGFQAGFTGNSHAGITVDYGACMSGNYHVMTVNYFAQGLSMTCCQYPVLPDPNAASGQIEITDCDANVVFAMGGYGVVNPDPTCDCTIATEETTWGSIKALYIE